MHIYEIMDETEAMKYFNRHDYNRALEIYLSILEEAEANNDTEKIAYSANLIGLCYYFLHRHSDAREYFEQALAHTTGEDHNKVQKNIDEMERYIARIEGDIKKITELLADEKDDTKRGILLSNLGILNYFIGKTESAESYLRQAETIFKKIGDNVALGAIYSNFALLYDDLRALDYLYRALDIFKEEGHLKGQADVYHSLALYYVFQDNLAEGNHFLKKEMEILENFDDAEMKKRCYELAADISLELGNVKDGMKFTEIASKI